MKNSDKINEILTLDLSSQEADIVWSAVKREGLDQNLDGLKTFLLMCSGMGERKEQSGEGLKFSQDSVKATVDFLQNNPEVLNGAKSLVLNGLKNKFFGKK
jgi:hypothetical protein